MVNLCLTFWFPNSRFSQCCFLFFYSMYLHLSRAEVEREIAFLFHSIKSRLVPSHCQFFILLSTSSRYSLLLSTNCCGIQLAFIWHSHCSLYCSYLLLGSREERLYRRPPPSLVASPLWCIVKGATIYPFLFLPCQSPVRYYCNADRGERYYFE